MSASSNGGLLTPASARFSMHTKPRRDDRCWGDARLWAALADGNAVSSAASPTPTRQALQSPPFGHQGEDSSGSWRACTLGCTPRLVRERDGGPAYGGTHLVP
jgi:hypothetical protein